MKNKDLNEAERLLLHEVMFEMGIIPMETPSMDVSRVLKQLPEAEARKLKRKFRKLWRKHRNDSGIQSKRGTAPTRWEKRGRKSVIWHSVMSQKVHPAIDNLVNGNQNDKSKSVE